MGQATNFKKYSAKKLKVQQQVTERDVFVVTLKRVNICENTYNNPKSLLLAHYRCNSLTHDVRMYTMASAFVRDQVSHAFFFARGTALCAMTSQRSKACKRRKGKKKQRVRPCLRPKGLPIVSPTFHPDERIRGVVFVL